jgi:hypothetical protein
MSRRGFALFAVLCALVIMSMVVAVNAQRALLMARLSMLDLARTEMAAAVAAARATLLDLPVDSAVARTGIPGTVLAQGETAAGPARAQWRLVTALPPFAAAEIASRAPILGGSARAIDIALVTPVRDSLGGYRWALAGGAGWVRLPSP